MALWQALCKLIPSEQAAKLATITIQSLSFLNFLILNSLVPGSSLDPTSTPPCMNCAFKSCNNIVAKASRRFASRFVGDKEIISLISADEQEALMAFHQADSQASDINMLEGDANTYSIINRTKRRTY